MDKHLVQFALWFGLAAGSLVGLIGIVASVSWQYQAAYTAGYAAAALYHLYRVLAFDGES